MSIGLNRSSKTQWLICWSSETMVCLDRSEPWVFCGPSRTAIAVVKQRSLVMMKQRFHFMGGLQHSMLVFWAGLHHQLHKRNHRIEIDPACSRFGWMGNSATYLGFANNTTMLTETHKIRRMRWLRGHAKEVYYLLATTTKIHWNRLQWDTLVNKDIGI